VYQTKQVDPEWNRKVLSFYLPYFQGAQRVLDVGCGQGDFLELLAADGIAVQGVDIDAQMVAHCRTKGLPVVEADLFPYLTEQKERFDGIFSSNVIEHLSSNEAVNFVSLACAALQPGGVLLIATPNPKSLIVHLHEFWRDATHVRLYSAELLEFLLSLAGFTEVTSHGNPYTIWNPGTEYSRWGEFLMEEENRTSRSNLWKRIFQAASFEKEGETWLYRLRRRVARFLVHNVMFEDFESLIEGMNVLDVEIERLKTISATLYAKQSALLRAPREVFVVGRKPSNEAV
jgi:SAM-dependent methyltransferase